MRCVSPRWFCAWQPSERSERPTRRPTEPLAPAQGARRSPQQREGRRGRERGARGPSAAALGAAAAGPHLAGADGAGTLRQPGERWRPRGGGAARSQSPTSPPLRSGASPGAGRRPQLRGSRTGKGGRAHGEACPLIPVPVPAPAPAPARGGEPVPGLGWGTHLRAGSLGARGEAGSRPALRRRDLGARNARGGRAYMSVQRRPHLAASWILGCGSR